MRRSLLATYRPVSWASERVPGAAAVRMPRPRAPPWVELDVEVDGRRPGRRRRPGQVAQRVADRPGDGQRLEHGVVRSRRTTGQLLDDDAAPRVALGEVGVDAAQAGGAAGHDERADPVAARTGPDHQVRSAGPQVVVDQVAGGSPEATTSARSARSAATGTTAGGAQHPLGLGGRRRVAGDRDGPGAAGAGSGRSMSARSRSRSTRWPAAVVGRRGRPATQVVEDALHVGLVGHHQPPGRVQADLQVPVVAAYDVEAGAQEAHAAHLPGERGSGRSSTGECRRAAPPRTEVR